MPACDRLTPDERSSLEMAATLLEARHPREKIDVPNDGTFVFDMNHVVREPFEGETCNTVGCILGLAHEIEKAQDRPETWHNAINELWRSGAAEYLFYPGWFGDQKYNITTPAMAGAATRRFLAGNDRPWDGFDPC